MCFPNVAPLERVENSQEIFEKLRETDSSAGVFYFFFQKLPRIPRMGFFALTFMQITLGETSPDFLLVAVC